MSSSSVGIKADNGVVRFCFGDSPDQKGNVGVVTDEGRGRMMKKKKNSRKSKLNELRFYRLKAKKKMKSSNPEVRIRYKLGKVVFVLSRVLMLLSNL